MFLKILAILILSIACNSQKIQTKNWAIIGNPLARARPCNDTDEVIITFEAGRPPEDENQYELFVDRELPAHTRASLEFDSEATVTLADPDKARISTIGNTFLINYFKNSPDLHVNVRGPVSGSVPYIKKIVINAVDFCKKPNTGYLNGLILGTQPSASVSLTIPDDTCGRRKVEHTELIFNGQPTKPGDWPWHVALYRFDGTTLKYICGGTLISKSLVLTASHCVTFRGATVIPETTNVVLGKYNLIGGDITSTERQIHEIIVHKDYNFKLLNHDIALLKLKSEVVFNEYIQPACLWHSNDYKRLPSREVIGTVVGWGFDQKDTLSSQLQQAKMPKVSESTCLKSNPLFYSRLLTEHKFCAGYRNGTSACNGDSGGAFVVFVPDESGNNSSDATGTWHVRGIVSTSVSRTDLPLCDPAYYVLFTDVAKYREWIQKYMK